MPGPKRGAQKGKGGEEQLSEGMSSPNLDSLVTMQSNLMQKLEPVEKEVPEQMMVDEERETSSDPLLQGVVLGDSAEGEMITGVMEDDPPIESSPPAPQPTFMVVQQQASTSQEKVMEARTADGSIVQLRQISGPSTPTTSRGLTGLKPLQQSIAIKRQATTQPTVTKVIISGDAAGTTSQPMMISSPIAGTSSPQTIKLVTSSPGGALPTNSRTITLAQAQQMGLISSAMPKVHLAASPSGGKQNIVLNKVVTSTKSPSAPKITMVPQGSKAPAKILPAPGGLMKPAVGSVAQMNTNMGGVKLLPGQQKIIIRQAAPPLQGLKQGTVLSPSSSSPGSQLIRIPATQNIISKAGEPQTIQVNQGGRTVQYLKLVTSPPSNISPKIGGTTILPAKQNIAPAPMKMVPIAPALPTTTAVRSMVRQIQVAPKPISGNVVTQKVMIPSLGPASPAQLRQVAVSQVAQMAGQVSPAAVTQLGGALVPTAGGNYMVLPAQVYDQLQAVPHTPPVEVVKLKERTTPRLVDTTPRSAIRPVIDTNGIRPRKPCNCTKSQCLKLYCDCFANGEFCNSCNCNLCFNNLEHEEERQKAIRACLERNPQAFKPKIGKTQVGDERRHNKGCNCRRSGCLKNYCECYEARIPCTNMCKCIGCRNLENNEERKLDRENVVMAAGLRARQQHLYAANRARTGSGKKGRGAAAQLGLFRQPFGFMNQRLVEATCECLLAQARQGEEGCSSGENDAPSAIDEAEIERRVLEEYGNCLTQFIQCSTKLEQPS